MNRHNPSHPGLIIRDDVLPERQPSVNEAAEQLGVSRVTLSRVINGRSAIKWSDGKLRVWRHSQGVFPLRGDLAKALRTPVDNITVMHREGSGCYGHNGAALDAALLARALPGVPVQLQWMRGDEFGWEPLGSPMVMKAQDLSRRRRICSKKPC